LEYRISTFCLSWLLTLAVTAGWSSASHLGGGTDLVPGGGAALDRVVFAVDGAESNHGADLRMWRSEPDGPQGPMQVSAAAAADVGGGDRFDDQENRALGRAYLARMYHRYRSWPDAVAAYNWGPGRMDNWISGGRGVDKLPPTVARYQNRVLAASGLAAGTVGGVGFGSINGRLTRLVMLRLQARRELMERLRVGSRPDAVELLYTNIMRATETTVR
jgi:Transglycosylase SLT domain